jgi:hypothetical protein
MTRRRKWHGYIITITFVGHEYQTQITHIIAHYLYPIDFICYGQLAVVSDLDDGGFALNVDNELRGSAVL